jgi:TetR/AcrR family transcriptional regulator
MKGIQGEHTNRDQILAVSWHLFQQKGYRGVSVDEICLQSGVTKPTLYYYFQDKEDLFTQVLEQQLSGFHRAGDQSGSLSERLQRVALAILESFQSDYSLLMRDREHLKRPENLRRIRDAFRNELFNPLQAILQSGIDTGELAEKNAETLTLVYLGILENFIGRTGEGNPSPAVLAEGLTRLFLRGAMQTAILAG